MSTYVVYAGGGFTTAAVKANTYELRIAQVSINSGSQSFGFVLFSRYVGGSISGGPAASCNPIRQGSPAVSATAAVGSFTPSGTQQYINDIFVAPGEIYDYVSDASYPGATASFESPLALTISPGSVFCVYGSWFDTSVSASIYFEELRLAGSY